MRIGVIGFGYWGVNIVRNFVVNPKVTSVVVCDLDGQRLKMAKKTFPGVETSCSAREVIQSKEIDLIAIVTPVSSHFELAKSALSHGKHVFVEKPMTSNAEQAYELVQLSKAQNKLLAVDHTFIYTPAVQKIKELIDKGHLGELWYFDSVRINLGLYQHDVNVIWDLAAHDLAILLYVTSRRPLSVSAHGSSHVGNGLEDIAYLTFTYQDCFISHFHVNWLAPKKIRQVIIGGSEKMLIWDDLNNSEKLRVYDKGITISNDRKHISPDVLHPVLVKYRTGDMWAPHLDNSEALNIQITNLINCVETDTRPLASGFEGLQVVSILEAAQESIRNGGQRIDINYREN